MISRKQAIVAVMAALLLGLSACVTKAPQNTIGQFNAEYQRVKGAGYLIHPGDQLDITFFYTPEYNATAIPVRPDGKIQLPVVGEFAIAGMTPDQAGAQLKLAYSKELKNPDLAVIVKGFGANSVTVQGEVRTPAELPLVADTSLLQIIGRAGGALPTANMSKVTVVRHSTGGKPLVITLDVRRALQGLDPSVDIPLLPGDVIYVPLLIGTPSSVDFQDLFGKPVTPAPAPAQ